MNGKRNHRTQPQGLVLFFEKKTVNREGLLRKDATQKRISLVVPNKKKKKPRKKHKKEVISTKSESSTGR